MSTPNTSTDELAAPPDLLPTNCTRSFAGRMVPNQSWARLGVSLAKPPRTLARCGGGLARVIETFLPNPGERP